MKHVPRTLRRFPKQCIYIEAASGLFCHRRKTLFEGLYATQKHAALLFWYFSTAADVGAAPRRGNSAAALGKRS